MALSPLESRYQRALARAARFTEQRPVNFCAQVKIVDADIPPFTIGGMLDPASRMYVGPADEPAVVWEVGHQQLAALNFYRDQKTPRCVLIGAMGSGKTEILARAGSLYGMMFRNACAGVVAPTGDKLGVLRKKLSRLYPPDWVVEDRKAPIGEPGYIELINGWRWQFVSAKEPSHLLGTGIHGLDWVAALIDEEQQCSDESIADVISRGRDAPDGFFPILSSCTISDAPEFRARLQRYRTDRTIELIKMPIHANPWIPEAFIASLRAQLTPRQYAQRVLAEEQAPERQTYYNYKKDTHIRELFHGAKDITRKVTGADILIGHDPGEMVDVSVLLRCYFYKGKNIWFIIDELTTERSTPQEHARQLIELLNTSHNSHWVSPDDEGNMVLDKTQPWATIRADPHGNTENRPHITYYREYKILGFPIKPAVFKKTANPGLANNPGQLPKNARINVLNTLFMNAAGKTRLYLLADSRGGAIAAKTAIALEMSQRDEYGRAETQKKDEHDLSHWVAALGYALYPFEHARIVAPLQEAA